MNRLIYLMWLVFLSANVTAQELKLEVLQAHPEGVTTVMLPAHSLTLFSGGNDGKIYGWDKVDGRQTLSLQGQRGAVEVFCDLNGQLISAGREEAIYVWNTVDGSLNKKLEGHQYYVETLAGCPKTNLLISGSRDNSIKIWDVYRGRQRSYLDGHEDNVLAVAVHPNEHLTASSGEDHRLRIWDMNSHQVVKEMVGEEQIKHLAFSPDGHYLIGVLEKKMLVWDIATWEVKYHLRAHTAPIEAIEFRPGSTILGSVDRAGKVIFWDLPEGKLLRSFIPRDGHLTALAFSNDGGELALGFQNGLVQLWNIEVLDQ